ncbi:MAG: hypothetical protein OXF08_02550 [Bacteroidetes bacterium]|nr:hypothetical protein [Bacteroidota bacterium]
MKAEPDFGVIASSGENKSIDPYRGQTSLHTQSHRASESLSTSDDHCSWCVTNGEVYGATRRAASARRLHLYGEFFHESAGLSVQGLVPKTSAGVKINYSMVAPLVLIRGEGGIKM